ncbi:hypothetical protein [Azospirillum sp. sgz302134]
MQRTSDRIVAGEHAVAPSPAREGFVPDAEERFPTPHEVLRDMGLTIAGALALALSLNLLLNLLGV